MTTAPTQALVPTKLDAQMLLAKAIDKGVDVGVLERLVELAKDVRSVTAREAFFEAMAEFKKKCPPITKDAVANTGRYSYKYATLNSILETVQPLLTDQGLTVSWRQKHEGQAVHASCVITHRQGHQEESGFIAMPFDAAGQMNPAQRVGSAATYAKRYSLLAVLGIAPEDDDDAQSTRGGGGEPPRTAQTTRSANIAPAPSVAPLGSPDVALEPTAPSNPDAPELVEESHELFPDPMRQQLVEECGAIIKRALSEKKITQKDVRAMKATYLGAEDANPDKCDIAALTDLSKYLLSRFGA